MGVGNNRKAVTFRLNLDEQHDLRELAKLWGIGERQVLKLAFHQFVKASQEMYAKMQAAEPAAQEATDATTETAG